MMRAPLEVGHATLFGLSLAHFSCEVYACLADLCAIWKQSVVRILIRVEAKS